MNTKVIPFFRVDAKKKNGRLEGKIHNVFGSQGNFADALGQSESLVSRVVSGQASLSPNEKERWATTLESNLHELF